jgi:hypothetical protein
MDVPVLDIKDFMEDKIHIGSKLISQLLKTLKFKSTEYTCNLKHPQNQDEDINDLILEETFAYNDIMYSLEQDKKSHKYVLKRGKQFILTCYEPKMDRIAIRTLQQRLSDISTSYVIKNFSDKTYAKLFASFYKPMSKLIDTYCRYRKLSNITDVCFFYKGGNVFRILLSDIVDIFTNQEYKDLMKRSDADFQIYINPSLQNVETIREEVSKLVVYVLYILKIHMKKGNTIRIGNDTTNIINDYRAELEKEDLDIKELLLYTTQKATRSDFLVSLGSLTPKSKQDYIIIRKYASIIEGIESRNSTYFISRNTSLDFKRKDNRRATFDLIRFRRNFKLFIELANGEQYTIGAPFEIIDVSIPKENDFGLKKMQKSIQTLVMNYVFKNKLIFKAPTLDYLLLDLHDLLFKQNEYPWQDLKYDKRVTRYFLTIIVYEIVDNLKNGNNIIQALGNIQQSFKIFVNVIDCITCKHPEINGYTNNLLTEYKKLHQRILAIPDEAHNFSKFGDKLKGIFKQLQSEINHIIQSFDTDIEKKINKMYNILFIQGSTTILG